MSKRRKVSAEFKRGALEQANQPGVSCAQVSRELGIRNNLLTPRKLSFVTVCYGSGRDRQSDGQLAADTGQLTWGRREPH